jgi:hypothetical protein
MIKFVKKENKRTNFGGNIEKENIQHKILK